jgi:hypothetical protein
MCTSVLLLGNGKRYHDQTESSNPHAEIIGSNSNGLIRTCSQRAPKAFVTSS